MTSPATPPAFDTTGYTITPQQANNPNAQTTYSIVRDVDGVGLGAYAEMAHVYDIITRDREMIASLPKGIGYIPPLVNTEAGYTDNTPAPTTAAPTTAP